MSQKIYVFGQEFDLPKNKHEIDEIALEIIEKALDGYTDLLTFHAELRVIESLIKTIKGEASLTDAILSESESYEPGEFAYKGFIFSKGRSVSYSYKHSKDWEKAKKALTEIQDKMKARNEAESKETEFISVKIPTK